jgi:hypothetical protein
MPKSQSYTLNSRHENLRRQNISKAVYSMPVHADGLVNARNSALINIYLMTHNLRMPKGYRYGFGLV